MKRCLMTGAIGLTGRLLLERLLRRFPEAQFFCTQRVDSASPRLLDERVHYLDCDVQDAEGLRKALDQAWPLDAVIHLVQLRYVPQLLQALASCPAQPRLVVVGTTGVFSRYQAYAREYAEAEALLRERYPRHVLVRPTMIYGDASDKNVHKLLRFVDRFGCFPVFGRGEAKMQPIHYEDLAEALLAIVERPHLDGRAYNLSGAAALTYRELLRQAGSALGRPCRVLPLPFALGVAGGRVIEWGSKRFGLAPPLREEQVWRLLEDKDFDHADAARELGFAPRSFALGVTQEVERMRAQGLLRERRGLR